MFQKLPILKVKSNILKFLGIFLLLSFGLIYTSYRFYLSDNKLSQTVHQLADEVIAHNQSLDKLQASEAEVAYLQNQDQYKINQDLKTEINNITTTYTQATRTYEDIVDLGASSKQTSKFQSEIANVFNLLANQKYDDATKALSSLNTEITTEKDKIAAAAASVPAVPANTPVNNTPPNSGFSVQQVQTDQGTFVVDIVAADLGSTKIIVDTASDSDCGNNCPVLPLSTYVSRNGAFAGINGAFFCPASYPSCAGKTNSFDTLLMNKNKYYFNSANNIYSTIPAVIFSGGSVRFVSQSLQWGRDTSVDSVLANYPLLVQNSQVVYSGSSDEPKFLQNGARCFVANKGSTVYIGIVQNATMINSAAVMKAMGMDNALNLDEGGSTALWYGGRYIAGPGRDLPDTLLLTKR